MKQKIVSISIILILAFLSACGTNSGGESTAATTTPNSVTERLETRSNEITSAHAEQNTLRLDGDYDSVPTVTQPAPLSKDELNSIVIPTSPKDPYSYIISDIVEWYKQAGSNFNPNEKRYCLYDINSDGTEELIIANVDILGGTSIYEEHEGITAQYTYGILISRVYTIKDGDAVRANQLIVGGNAYQTILLDTGMIKVIHRTPRNPQITYYKMVGDDFEVVGGCLYKNFDNEYFYDGNDEEVKITEEEFNRRIAEIEGDATPVEIEWKRIDQYGQ